MILHILAWIVVIFLTLVGGPTFVSPATYEQLINQEVANSNSSFGDAGLGQVSETTNEIFGTLVVISAVDFAMKSCEPPQPGFSSWVKGKICAYSSSAANSIYLISFRLAQLLYWFAFFVPFLFAAIVDGAMKRKVHLASFHYTSPGKYKGLWHAAIAAIAILFLSIPLAIGWPALYVPFLLSSIAILVRTVIANVQSSV